MPLIRRSTAQRVTSHPGRRLLAAIALGSLVALGGCARAGREQPTHETATAFREIRFENQARTGGLRHRWHRQPRPLRNLDSFGCGCAFLDYDNDGWQDILLVDTPHAVLYRNRQDGTFEDVSETTGLSRHRGDWKGCAVGDYDGSGSLDLLLTGYRRLALLNNREGRAWVDMTAAAGLDPANRRQWGSSAGFMDLDADGRLDLALLNYVVFGPQERQYCELRPGIMGGCPPGFYAPEFPELWQNLGNGRFQDRTAFCGIKDTNGKALVLAFADIDDDGRIDFYIGNDTTPSDLMRNLGGMRFENIGVSSGAAYGEQSGQGIAAMCADWGDYDRDGRLDLVVTANSDESYSLLRNAGGGLFEYASRVTGISGPTFKPLGFGGKWLDMDNDGWLDLVFANGHVQDVAPRLDPQSTFRQPLMLFHNQRGWFVDLVPALGGDLAAPLLGRGLATGDYDNDGRIDILVVDYEGAPLLLQNRSRTSNHWLKLDLRMAGSNRFAYGARVTASAGRQFWVAEVSPASSYLSSSDPRLHLGLGDVTLLDNLTIRWPSGRRDTLRKVPVDRILRVEEEPGIAPKASQFQ
jgi:enediyne biosynthesis protein E4